MGSLERKTISEQKQKGIELILILIVVFSSVTGKGNSRRARLEKSD